MKTSEFFCEWKIQKEIFRVNNNFIVSQNKKKSEVKVDFIGEMVSV